MSSFESERAERFRDPLHVDSKPPEMIADTIRWLMDVKIARLRQRLHEIAEYVAEHLEEDLEEEGYVLELNVKQVAILWGILSEEEE